MWRRSRVQLHRHIVIPWRKASKHHSLGNPIGWEKLRRAESRWLEHRERVLNLGNGNGTFQTHTDYAVGNGAVSVTTADPIRAI